MEYLRQLAQEAGIDSSDDEAVRRMDRKRKKKTSNEEWVNPHDPEAEVTKMKDGTTHLAYKAEQAVDLDTGAIVAITTHGGAAGDSESITETLPAAGYAVAEQIDTPTAQGSVQGACARAVRSGHRQGLSQRRGFGGDEGVGVRTYVSVPKQPRRNWKGKAEQQAAVYANRRRVEGERGKAYCGGAASCWSVLSRINMRRARCGGCTCAAGTMSPSESYCRRRHSISR